MLLSSLLPGVTLRSESDFLGSSPGFGTVSNIFIPSVPPFSYSPHRIGVSSSHSVVSRYLCVPRILSGSMKSKLFS